MGIAENAKTGLDADIYNESREYLKRVVGKQTPSRLFVNENRSAPQIPDDKEQSVSKKVEAEDKGNVSESKRSVRGEKIYRERTSEEPACEQRLLRIR